MTGPKTNERPGTRARGSYVRTSAYKAREVLNQIRGKSYGEAAEILAFSERGISHEIASQPLSAVSCLTIGWHKPAPGFILAADYGSWPWPG